MIIYSNNSIIESVKSISRADEFEKDFYYHYLYIVSHIRLYPILDRRFSSEDFIPIQMKVLKKLVSYDYAHKFLKNLIEGGILKTDNFYIKGLKSRGYKLEDKFKREKFFRVECKDLKLKKKITTVHKNKKNKVFKESFGYGYVTNCMESLDIDYKNAIKFIDETIEEENRESAYTITADLFEFKFATVDDKGKRLHNNLTNISRDLRKFITYKNKGLVQVDIKNSQPLFLYLMMKDYFISDDEMEKYKNVVLNIGFYEFFAEKIGFDLNEDNRKNFKQKIFSGVLFDRNRSKYSKYEEVFKKEFPAIFHVVRSMKNYEYEQVAINLQKTESKFIFYCVEKVAKESKIPLFTIHDSICTVEGKEGLVKKVMLEEFIKIHDISPKLNVEKFV